MFLKDDLGNRMKTYYEEIPKTKLLRRTPVIIRIDGKAFHTFTRGFKRPFDDILINSMQETTKYLCENIQGCVLGYTQSDEITLVLVDYKNLDSSAWFDYEVQKMCSVAASMATMAFNKFFYKNAVAFDIKLAYNENGEDTEENRRLCKKYMIANDKGAMFDARVFNIPKEEVTNCIYWRQLDASRNSIQMVGQSNFPHKQLQGKSCSDIQDMLMLEKGINWNDYPTYQKRGSCVIKKEFIIGENGEELDIENLSSSDSKEIPFSRTQWVVDKDIPIFKGEGRDYIEKLVIL